LTLLGLAHEFTSSAGIAANTPRNKGLRLEKGVGALFHHRQKIDRKKRVRASSEPFFAIELRVTAPSQEKKGADLL
jgi:hypothetical protein